MSGWVYAFATPSMPDVVKIGATRRNPSERLDEANASDTWRPPRPYVVVCATEVADPFACERAIHALLAARRVNTRHEFFEITAHEARVLLPLLAAREPREPREPRDPPVSVAGDESESEAPAVTAVTAFTAAPLRAARRETPTSEEAMLREWVDASYTRIPLREKDTGTKLEAIYRAYTSATPPVHAKMLGRNKLAAMLSAVCPNIGPHRNTTNTIASLYLVRAGASAAIATQSPAQERLVHVPLAPPVAASPRPSPEDKLRAWVESMYAHISLSEKDTGTKLEQLYAAYAAATPPIHTNFLGRNTFVRMLTSVYPSIGPHRNTTNTVASLYLLR